MNRVTLQDIAEDMQISKTTVHRALQGKEGISEELRKTIIARAREMGYQANYVASSLKRKTITLAVVLPQKEGSGRYYHKYIWEGIDTFKAEAKSLNVEIEYYFYGSDKQEQIRILDQLFQKAAGEVSGLLTVPASSDEESRMAVERFSYKNIPVVLMDADLKATSRLCCVAPHDYQTGRLGAEFLSLIINQKGKILVARGDRLNDAHSANLRGFIDYLKEHKKPLEVISVEGYGNYDDCYQQALTQLQTDNQIRAFYSVTARDTIPLTQAVIDCNLSGKLYGVGSDLYPDSADLLRRDVLQALIYKNAYDIGHTGFDILFNYVIKNVEPKTEQVMVPISIIMKNNLDFFMERI
jgi:LacI family transcriptional regulator